MNRDGRFTVLAVDLACGSALALCVGVFLWLTVIRNDTTSTEIGRLKRTVDEARRDLASLRAVRDEQRALLLTRKTELSETGQLPDELAMVEYFQAVSRIAAGHSLRVIRHKPVLPRRYPGLFEQRFEYELSGSLPDLVRFLSAVEETDFWADIGYLEVAGGPGVSAPGSADKHAVLTFSLFSALPDDPVPEKG